METKPASEIVEEEVTGGVKIHKLFERSSIMSRIKQAQTSNGTTVEGGNIEINISKFQRTKSRANEEDDEEMVMKSMESLSKTSELMNRGLRRQQQETEERAKLALQKQQEAQAQLTVKVTTSKQELESTVQTLQTNKVKLESIQEKTLSKKQELLTLKQLKEQMASQSKDEQDQEMIEKNNKINEMTEILEQIKIRGQKARQINAQYDTNISEEERMKVSLSMKLNEMGNEIQKQTALQHTTADFDKEIREGERLQLRIKQLQKLKEQSQAKIQSLMTNIEQLKINSPEQNYNNELVKSEASRQQLIQESKSLKADNKLLFDTNLDLLNQMKELQVTVQLEETKNLESVVIANLLMDQNKFERYSRLVQVDIESIEDSQRLREDTRKELQTNLIQIQKETELSNPELEKNITDFKKKLQQSEIDKQELEDEIRALMGQVCNKRPEELKIEQIDSDYDRLVDYKAALEDFKNKEQLLQDELDTLGKLYQEYEQKLKHQFHQESASFIDENGSIIGSLVSDMKTIADKTSSIDAILREKVAHTEEQMQLLEQTKIQLSQIKANAYTLKHDVDYEKGQLVDFKDDQGANDSKLETTVKAKKGLQSYEVSIIDFVVVRRDLSDQNERLKALNGKNIKDLLDLLDDVSQQIAQLDEALSTDQKEKCQRLIDDGLKLCGVIDQDIKQLQDRLTDLEQETAKVDPNQKQSYIDEIEKVKDTLVKLKAKKDTLEKNLNDIASKGDSLVQNQGKLKDIVSNLQGIQDKDLKQTEKEVDKLEEKLKVAIRQFKNDKKKECINQIAKAESKLESFNDAINDVQVKIDAINRECARLENDYDFDDKERENDLTDIRIELQKEQDKLAAIQKNRDNFKEQVDDLKRDAENLEQNNLSTNVEITNQWLKAIEKTKQLNSQMEPEIKISFNLEQEVDQVKEKLAKAQDKYKQKNQLYQECLDKKQENQALLDNYKAIMEKSEIQLEESRKLLDQMIPVPGDKEFMKKYDDAKRQYQDGLQNIAKQKSQIESLQQKIDNVDNLIGKLAENVVSNKDLTKLRDDLGKLDHDINYQTGQAKELNKEASDLLVDVQDLYDLNKKLKEKEIEQKLADLSIDINKADKLQKEALFKLDKYQQLIQKALQSEDEGVVESANKLKQEAADIEKELAYIDTLKNNLKNQEAKLKEKLLKLQANRNKSTVKDFDDLSNNFGSMNEQSGSIVKDLVRIIEDLDNRTIELDDYMKKFNDLQGMYKDFDTMLANLHNQNKRIDRQMEDCEVSVGKLQAVLIQMEKGVARDYKLKEGLIVKQLNELDKVQTQYEGLKQQRTIIDNKIKQVQDAGDQSLDNEALGELISQVKQMQVELENQDIEIKSCNNSVQKCRSTVHDADIPQLVQVRESETTEFSRKLRKAETEVADLKKILINSKGLENYKELEANYKSLEKQLALFKENGQIFKRVLGQELQLLLPNPQVLQDLDIQRETIIKIITLGDQLNDQLDEINKFLVMAAKFKNQIGGLDLIKRHREMTAQELDHQKRLAEVKKRFDRIDIGANDCDGYTSNPEEETFVETLIGELPQMQDKLKETVEFSDTIKNSLVDILPAVQAANSEDTDNGSNDQLIENLDEVENQVNSNEKTVAFLEKLADKLENHFISMEVKKKLDRRQLELKELLNICTEFEQQLIDLQDNLRKDLEKIERRKSSGDTQEMLVDEEGQKINLLEELLSVQEDLQEILDEVNNLADKNASFQETRDTAAQEFSDQVLNKSPFKGQQRVTNKGDVFTLLRSNGWMKRKIIKMIQEMKDVSRQLRDAKGRYQNARIRLQRSNKQKKIYKAVKGDLVDELFANYINMLNCPVPINRLGNNQYTFGTKKIFAKIINGKLVIRVGGGYMGIEEFMMYYGQQELLRIQKREYLMMDNDDNDVVEDRTPGKDDNGGQQEDLNDGNGAPPQRYYARGGLTKSIVERAGSPGGVKRKPKQDASKEEIQNQNQRTTVVGLGDVRKALKQNLIEIKTYQDHSTVDKLNTAEDVQSRNQVHQNSATKRVAAESNAVKEELKQMEQQAAGEKNKSRPQTTNNTYRQAMGSPKTGSQVSSKEGSSRRNREDRLTNSSQASPSMSSPKPKQVSKIPAVKR